VRTQFVIATGAILGLVSTLGILFDRRTEGKGYIIGAGTIRGVLVALLVASSPVTSGWLGEAGLGALYGAVVALMVVLWHGRSARRHAIYIFPPSIVSGALIGVLIARLGS
jgi:presenilin-like A22 family membrane protease